MSINDKQRGRELLAFTLVEMITVIAIIAIVATLVVSMGQAASSTKKQTAVKGELNRLETMINNYYAKLNYYPPDNGLLTSYTMTGYNYDAFAATNPLIYELSGATNTNSGNTPSLFVFNSSNNTVLLSAANYSNIFNRGGVANGDSSEPHNFFIPGPTAKECGVYAAIANGSTVMNICGVLVPVEFTNVQIPNFFHYDSSTTNRHNLGSYDIWAEYSIGKKNGVPIMITNGNW